MGTEQCEWLAMDGSRCPQPAAVEWMGCWLCRDCYQSSKQQLDSDPYTQHRQRRREYETRQRGAPRTRQGVRNGAARPLPPVVDALPHEMTLELHNDYRPGAVAVCNGRVPFMFTDELVWQGGDDSKFSLDQLIRQFGRVDVYPLGNYQPREMQ